MVRATIVPVLFLSVVATTPGHAQRARPPEDGGFTEYLGQPHRWQRHAGAGAGFIFAGGTTNLLTEGRLGLYTDLVNPVIGLAGFQGEVYAGLRGPLFDYGLRAQLLSPYLRLGLGFDMNGLDRDPYFLISLFHPIRRGGVLGGGSLARLNFLPGRDRSFSVGVEVPVGRRINMGQTRPRASAARLDAPATSRIMYTPSTALLDRIAELASSARWITRMTVPFLEQSAINDAVEAGELIRELRELKRYLAARSVGRAWGPDDEVRRFHDAMDEAFSLAVSGSDIASDGSTSLGRYIADQARQVLLDEILLPYDRLLGQVKEPNSLAGLGLRARGVFVRQLHMGGRVPPDWIDPSLWVFTELILVLESVRREAHARWGDSRFAWLPLQFGLRPEQHDSQAELDALIERATGVAFRDGNRVWYVVNEQFPLQLSRTIHEARDYHVLWIHDVRGLDETGHPDEITYRHVLGTYLGALIERVKAYDATGRFPVFMIFLDQYYYETNRTRFWMNLLENPLRHRLELPRGFGAWEDSIAAAQAALREAVAGSRLLQYQTAQFGRNWLHNLVRVHVSITNPADPSFWRNDVVPIFGLPDNVMRDHRKIAFYDVTEDDPYRGGAIYTGAGVGEAYTTLNWEDRSLIVEGPVLLTLKDAARELLLNQGIQPERIPWALQPRPLAPDYEDRIHSHIETGGMNVRALEVHNQTGYNPKDLNVVKALLYTMMPAGSVVIVPDALWSSGFWSGALVGHALRGGRSLIIAPALKNAPSPGLPGMIRSHEVLSRVLLASIALREEIEAQHGLLQLGIYSPTYQVTDLFAKLNAFRQTLQDLPWFRDLYDLRPDVYAAFERLSEGLRGQNERWQRRLAIETQGTSKLHLKANFLASKDAWEGLLHLPDWPEVLRVFMAKRAWQIENRDHALGRLEAPMPDVIDVGQPMLDNWIAGLSAEQRDQLILYLLLGSHNQNYRSMVMDGEAAVVVAGTSINAGLIDLVALTGQCEWIESVDQLEKHLPQATGLRLRFARWLRLLL